VGYRTLVGFPGLHIVWVLRIAKGKKEDIVLQDKKQKEIH
jgi:hypothetical protein